MAKILVAKKSKYLGEDFLVSDASSVKAHLEALADTEPQTAEELITLIEHFSQINMAIEDEMSRRYVAMTTDTLDETKEKAFNDFYASVVTMAEPIKLRILKLYYFSPYRNDLPAHAYAHLNRIIASTIELFREENLPLMVKESELANKYGGIVGKMTAFFDGKEQTMSQLRTYMKDPDRQKREQAWHILMQSYQQKEQQFDALFDELKALRIDIAHNADFDNYRDYMHQSLGRFSYTPDDLFTFHDAVAKEVVPFCDELNENRKEKLGLEQLMPWDTAVDLDGKVLKPFDTTQDFIFKTTGILASVNPEYAKQFANMDASGLLDLENRKGKAPGGYNTTLHDLGASFIFMNHVKQHGDLVTLLHEAGHAMHSAAMANIPISAYKDVPSEVAELASMSMEFLSMNHWNQVYHEPSDLAKAKRDQLEGALSFLPWCMSVDAFQHWVYTHPEHTATQRKEAFLSIQERFFPSVSWSGVKEYQHLRWMQQLHIFEVPFYYIEYGMAQLGALSIYMNYKENPALALEKYQNFLDFGYSKPVSELYRTAGIEFDFSAKRIKQLVDFVKQELQNL